MSKFKAGDLALVVGCQTIDHNVGKIVELMHFVKSDEVITIDGQKFRAAKDAWIVSGDSVGWWSLKRECMVIGHHGMIAEKHLMPLRDDFQPEQQKAMELVQ